MPRLITLDTETTGLDTSKGHRVIEIGCVEINNREINNNNEYHVYIQPNRNVGDSVRIHGITDKFLIDKPTFVNIADDFIKYIKGATLIIHNAAFDIGFLNHEFNLMGFNDKIEDICTIIDTIKLSKKMFPGSQHSLNALTRKYQIDIERELHGALLDAQILAEVYLEMTGGQGSLFSGNVDNNIIKDDSITKLISKDREPLAVIYATNADKLADAEYFN